MSETEFVPFYLNFLRLFLPSLTEAETSLLEYFLLSKPSHEFLRFSSKRKKEASEVFKVKMTTIYARLHSLIEKGYLFRSDDNLIMLKPNIQKMLATFHGSKFSFAINVTKKDGLPDTTDGPEA